MADGSVLEPRGARIGSVADPSGPFSGRSSVLLRTAITTMGVRGQRRRAGRRGHGAKDTARIVTTDESKNRPELRIAARGVRLGHS